MRPAVIPWLHILTETLSHILPCLLALTIVTHFLLQNAFGNATEGFNLFSSAGYGDSDLLFSDATHHLQRVLGSCTSWLGHSYTTILQAFECEGTSDCFFLPVCDSDHVFICMQICL